MSHDRRDFDAEPFDATVSPLPDSGDDRAGLDDIDDLDLFDESDEETELVDDADLDEGDLEDGDLDDDDYPEDAGEDDIDFAVAIYREDGAPVAQALSADSVNDLEALIAELRRLPGDAGAAAVVAIAEEFFALVRVRGRHVQVFLSDAVAAIDWPLARDISDYLGAELPDEDEAGPLGDGEIFADFGLSDFDLEAIASDLDSDADELALQLVDKIKFGPQFRKVVDVSFSD